jgi:hypothetical protein
VSSLVLHARANPTLLTLLYVLKHRGLFELIQNALVLAQGRPGFCRLGCLLFGLVTLLAT